MHKTYFLTKLQIFICKSYTLRPSSIPLDPEPSTLPLSTPFSPKYSNLPCSTRLYLNYSTLASLYPDYPNSPRSTPFYSKYLNPRPPYSALTKINSNQNIPLSPSLFTFAQNISPLACPAPLSPKLPFFAFISSNFPTFSTFPKLLSSPSPLLFISSPTYVPILLFLYLFSNFSTYFSFISNYPFPHNYAPQIPLPLTIILPHGLPSPPIFYN